MSNNTIVITQFNRPGYDELTKSPTGDLHKYLDKRGRRLVLLAKRQVGKKTRELEASIGYRIANVGNNPVLYVYALSEHAWVHHEGSRPHIIVPRHGRYLRFRSGGKIVYARAVMHPGTRANHYLTDHLREIVIT